MMPENQHTLVNQQTGKLSFKLTHFEAENPFAELQKLDYYSLIWIHDGSGDVHADFSTHSIHKNTLFAFSPYQPFKFEEKEKLHGVAIHFHPDFFCILKHHQEVACNGVLFNNIYNPPFVAVDEDTSRQFTLVIDQIRIEMQRPALAQYELLISYLKIFLITASRLKNEQQHKQENVSAIGEEPFVLQNLKNYIEQHYKTKHSASEYADLLAITPKALTKLTKKHFNRTLTDLISERIVIEAKRELYLTNKPIKEIAFELGYTDEFYFSRFFKKNAEVSPQAYRDTVGFNREASID